MAYTQAEINAALAAELAARPNTPQASLTDYAKATYGLTDAQINAAYDTIAGFNAQGQWDAADYIANSRVGITDPQMVVDAANAARAAEAAATLENLKKNSIQHSVVDPTTGQTKQLNPFNPAFNPNDPYTLAMLGSQAGRDSNADYFFATNPSYVPLAQAAWAKEKARLDAPVEQGLLTTGQTTKTYSPFETAAYNAYRSGDITGVNRAVQEGKLTKEQVQSSFGLSDADMNWMANNAGVKFFTPTTVTTGITGGTTGGTVVGGKTYTQAETDLYNAYRSGDMATVNRLLAANKWTGADIKSKFGLTDADISWITNNAGGQFYSPTGTKTGITDVINTIGGGQTQTAPVGQFRELFPSFAESKRLAGQMVANRPSTEQIVSMINSNAARPVTVGGVNYSAPESAAFNAYRSGNMPEFNRLTQLNQLTAPNMQAKFGLSDADMSWITNNAGGVFYNPTSTQQAAPASLNNVLSMISK
jgi:hypothetical protein